MHYVTWAIDDDRYDERECACGTTVSAPPIIYYTRLEAVKEEEFAPHHYDHLRDTLDGTRDAARRHDALARRKYVKPFKQFKFNRARRQRP